MKDSKLKENSLKVKNMGILVVWTGVHVMSQCVQSPNYAILRFGSEILLANWQRIKMTVLLRYKEV